MKKFVALFLTLAMLLGMASFAAADEPTDISLMMAYWVDQPPKTENNYLFEKFQEMLNVRLDLSLYPSANYVDKAMLRLASGDLPDVMWVQDSVVKTKAVIDAAEAGAFWDCTDLLHTGKYPNLDKAITKTMVANASINGRLYGMPGPRPSARNGIVYRKDVFDKYGIEEPTDMESFYQAAKTIKEKEPDLIPFCWGGGQIIDILCVSNGGYNGYGLDENGKIAPAWNTEPYKKSLALLRQMYEEGLINSDFAIQSGSETEAAMIAGKAAMIQVAYDTYERLYNGLHEVDPEAELDIIPVLNGVTNAQVGSAVYFISAAMPEEKRDAIFQYFNDSLNQDILTWEYYGEEGRNYTLDENGIPVFIDDEKKAEVNDTNIIYKSCAVNPVVIHWPSDSGVTKRWKDATETYADAAVRNYASPLLSETQTEKGGELDKILADARTQYIMGVIDEAGYDAAVELWFNEGGTKIVEEFNIAYEKAAK